METKTRDNELVPTQPLDRFAADSAADIESVAGEGADTPPTQFSGGYIADDPHAPCESALDEEGVRGQAERPPVLDETDAQPEAPATDEVRRSAKLEFLVETKDPPGTAKRVFELVREYFDIYQRGGFAVTIRTDDLYGRVAAKEMSKEDVVTAIHEVAQPYVVKVRAGGPSREEIALPERVAKLCLSGFVVDNLPRLEGIAYAPRVGADGSIHSGDGYDPDSGIYFHNLPAVNVPDEPTRQDAEAAFERVRLRVRTFPFADSIRVRVDGHEETVVDVSVPPGADEGAFIMAVVTAVCRPSLDRVPGVLITAPPLSGAGTGKGKLARFLAEVSCGISPIAMTAGHNAEEFDKRLAAVLMTAEPFTLIDNLNDRELQSNLVASAITENPAQVRLMRTSKLVRLNPATVVCVTGNGLSVTEDLGRRFLVVELNAGVESPAGRSFAGDFLAEARRARAAILSDVLTIVRWGLQQGDDLPRGRPLGNFERWCRMCRDAVLALSGRDPVADMANRQANDSQRAELAELFGNWWRHHGDRPTAANDLHEDVRNLLAPYGESRQRVATKLMRLAGTVCNGFRLRQIEKSARWGAHKYRLECLDPALAEEGHRTDGGDNGGQGEAADNGDFEGLRSRTGSQPTRRRR